MELREALKERELRDRISTQLKRTKEVQAELKRLKASGLDKLQALLENDKFIGGDWCEFMSKKINQIKDEAWG